jgi:hypothetical protein
MDENGTYSVKSEEVGEPRGKVEELLKVVAY